MRRAFLLMRAVLMAAMPQVARGQIDPRWRIHDEARPPPPVVEPGTASTPEAAGRAPSDAVILFSGRDLSQWMQQDGSPAKWKVENGYFEVVPGSGSIDTRQGFGDCQLHLELWEPVPVTGQGQGRGNSGVFLMGLYEIQVLDSYENRTYADGQAAAVYGQYPPLVNASRPPGQWQSYDIVFHGPRFGQDEKLLQPAHLTMFHNGVLVHDNVELSGPTGHRKRPPYKAHGAKLPLSLQDHGNPVRFRNIWIRQLKTGE